MGLKLVIFGLISVRCISILSYIHLNFRPLACVFFSFCSFDSKAENFCLQGAGIVKEVLEEAREIAMKEHNFEFATNMWVAESFTNQVTEQFIKPSRP